MVEGEKPGFTEWDKRNREGFGYRKQLELINNVT